MHRAPTMITTTGFGYHKPGPPNEDELSGPGVS